MSEQFTISTEYDPRRDSWESFCSCGQFKSKRQGSKRKAEGAADSHMKDKHGN